MKLRSGKIIHLECSKYNKDCSNMNSKLFSLDQKKTYTKEKNDDFEIKIYKYSDLCKTKNNVIKLDE